MAKSESLDEIAQKMGDRYYWQKDPDLFLEDRYTDVVDPRTGKVIGKTGIKRGRLVFGRRHKRSAEIEDDWGRF